MRPVYRAAYSVSSASVISHFPSCVKCSADRSAVWNPCKGEQCKQPSLRCWLYCRTAKEPHFSLAKLSAFILVRLHPCCCPLSNIAIVRFGLNAGVCHAFAITLEASCMHLCFQASFLLCSKRVASFRCQYVVPTE